MRIKGRGIASALLLALFALAILSDELESRRVSVINECLRRYFNGKAENGNKAAKVSLDTCRALHGLDNRFRWDNSVLHLLAIPACKYRNGWASNCLAEKTVEHGGN